MKQVSLRVSESTAKWFKWQKCGDHQRAKYRAKAVHRLIYFWERLRDCWEWTPISQFHDEGDFSERRWLRRVSYTLEVAGLIEVDPGEPRQVMQIRRKP